MAEATPVSFLNEVKTGENVIIFFKKDGQGFYGITKVNYANHNYLQLENGDIFFRDTGTPFKAGPPERLLNPTPEVLAMIDKQNQSLQEKVERMKQLEEFELFNMEKTAFWLKQLTITELAQMLDRQMLCDLYNKHKDEIEKRYQQGN